MSDSEQSVEDTNYWEVAFESKLARSAVLGFTGLLYVLSFTPVVDPQTSIQFGLGAGAMFLAWSIDLKS